MYIENSMGYTKEPYRTLYINLSIFDIASSILIENILLLRKISKHFKAEYEIPINIVFITVQWE